MGLEKTCTVLDTEVKSQAPAHRRGGAICFSGRTHNSEKHSFTAILKVYGGSGPTCTGKESAAAVTQGSTKEQHLAAIHENL